jgi:hypothetical protein
MKHLVLFCLVCVAASLAAQQLTEWRPNIAEDNKAATWEDTSAFIVGMLPVAANVVSIKRNQKGQFTDGRLDHVRDASVQDKCKIAFTQISGMDTKPNIYATSSILSLEKVDPLSVRVSPLADWPIFELTVSGTNGKSIVTGRTGTYTDFGSQADAYISGVKWRDLSAECGTKGLKCESHDVDEFQWIFSFSDLDSAKRVARGLQHAALLCGGTKAVSPF